MDICQEVECNDHSACTQDLCDSADPRVCIFINEPEDWPCGGGGVCDGAGTCLQCNRGEQCEDDVNECTVPNCDSADGACRGFTPVADGTACAGGTCLVGACELTGSVLPCTEQGILNAIAAGGGPYTFDCDGLTTVTTAAEIVIDNDVVLDGEGNLTVDGNGHHGVFHVPEGVTAELHGFGMINGIYGINWNFGTLTVTHSTVSGNSQGGIRNFGQMTLTSSTVTGNKSADRGGGIRSDGELTLYSSTVSGNSALSGGGIFVGSGTLTLVNSTVSGNRAEVDGGGIHTDQALMLLNSTVTGNTSPSGNGVFVNTLGWVTSMNSLVDGDCDGDVASFIHPTSLGYNIESPGDTCGFDQVTDQVNVHAEDLALGPLADNGGSTETHALLPGSVAIDAIPEPMCEVDEDQRGVTRPQADACDVGAFELEQGGP